MTASNKTYHTHIKKDDDGNEIARYDVHSTKEYININDNFVESWDLASEIRKKYEASLYKSIDDGAKFNKPILYFIVMVKKNAYDKQKIHIKIAISDKPLPDKKYESVDYWKYDYQKNKLSLIWSVPHKSAMKNYLKEPQNYDKDLIKWIKQFLDQEGMDLKKYEKKKVKIHIK